MIIKKILIGLVALVLSPVVSILALLYLAGDAVVGLIEKIKE